jgi:transcriptional regulator with XRE-family HTH domain
MGELPVAGRPDHRRRPRPLLRTTMGAALRRIRRAQGRTLAEVSRTARVSMPYLSEVERGRKEASSEILAAICDALRIDLADLLAGVAGDLAGPAGGRVSGTGPRQAQVVRLDTVRDRAPVTDRTGPADTVCLLAA